MSLDFRFPICKMRVRKNQKNPSLCRTIVEIKSVQYVISAPKLLTCDILLVAVNFDQNLQYPSRGSGDPPYGGDGM